MSNEREHLVEMRKFITAVDDPASLINDDQSSLSKVITEVINVDDLSEPIKESLLLATNLKNLGIDRLSILLDDRNNAELVLDNCNAVSKKILDSQFGVVTTIFESLCALLNNIPTERYDVVGIARSELFPKAVLKESIDVQINKVNVLVEKIKDLVSRWEMYKETSEDRVFAEGVEFGYSKASSELKEVLSAISNEENRND